MLDGSGKAPADQGRPLNNSIIGAVLILAVLFLAVLFHAALVYDNSNNFYLGTNSTSLLFVK